MTAPNTNSAASDNSVCQGTDDGVNTPANDDALVQIIDHTYETAGTTTRCDLETGAPWRSGERNQRRKQLEVEGDAELIGDSDRQLLLVGHQGKCLARGRR